MVPPGRKDRLAPREPLDRPVASAGPAKLVQQVFVVSLAHLGQLA